VKVGNEDVNDVKGRSRQIMEMIENFGNPVQEDEPTSNSDPFWPNVSSIFSPSLAGVSRLNYVSNLRVPRSGDVVSDPFRTLLIICCTW
jgi:hypothetical protein